MCFKIVAPSFVMTTSPWAVWIWKPSHEQARRADEPVSKEPKRRGAHELAEPFTRTILSMPLGPSEVRTASLTALAAFMFERRTSMGLPCEQRARARSAPGGRPRRDRAPRSSRARVRSDGPCH